MIDTPDDVEELADQMAGPITEDDSVSRRAARLRVLADKIERGEATEEEVAEFKREYPRLIEDMNEALNPFVEAYADAVTSMAETLAEPMEELAKSSIFSRSD